MRDTVCRCISERILRATLLVGLLSAIAGLGLQGLDLLGLPLARIVTVAPWRAALTTSLGPALLIALGAIVLAAVADRCRPLAVMRVASSVAMAGIGASLAASGHASTASPQWLMRMSVFVHGVCVAYWVGALLPLLGMLGRQSSAAMLPVLHRFSRGAVAAVGLLVLTGTVLAVVQMARFGALVDTAYGRLLAAKLVLVLALLGLAALNRWRLTPALAGAGQTDGCAAARLKYSIAGEIVIVLAILGVVAGWRFTPPPRALAAAAQSELSVHLHTAKGMVQVTITPGTSGNNTFDLQFMNEDLTPLKIVDASIVLTEPERGIAPISRTASRLADDRWVVRDVPLPFSGRWRLRVRGFITDFDELSVEDAFEVP
jgi:copper transport protein